MPLLSVVWLLGVATVAIALTGAATASRLAPIRAASAVERSHSGVAAVAAIGPTSVVAPVAGSAGAPTGA